MIEVRAWDEEEMHCLEMKGHAEAGAYGEDTVCAAASMLMYTLRARQQEMDAHPFSCCMNEGGFALLKVPKRMTETYETVISGLKLLSKEYPKNVVFTRD